VPTSFPATKHNCAKSWLAFGGVSFNFSKSRNRSKSQERRMDHAPATRARLEWISVCVELPKDSILILWIHDRQAKTDAPLPSAHIFIEELEPNL
jgi:hypothetical protein